MEQKQLTNQQAVVIGVKVGFLPVFFLLILILARTGFQYLDFLLIVSILGLGVILFGIIGAVVGYALGKTKAVTIISAILGTIIGSFGGMILLLAFLPQ